MKKRNEWTSEEWDAARYRLKDRAEGEPPYGPSSATPMDLVVIYLFLAMEALEEKIEMLANVIAMVMKSKEVEDDRS